MRVGSLVIYTNPEVYLDMITPDTDAIYTVRSVGRAISMQRPLPHKAIKLEEITNGIDENGKEFVYVADHFKEVQEPLYIAKMLEQIQQMQNQ